NATIVGDLTDLKLVPDATYDCLVITQVLQYVNDVPAAVSEMHRILRPGGVALVTVPALQKSEPRTPHYWKFTPQSLAYLFGRHFPSTHVNVNSRGNALPL